MLNPSQEAQLDRLLRECREVAYSDGLEGLKDGGFPAVARARLEALAGDKFATSASPRDEDLRRRIEDAEAVLGRWRNPGARTALPIRHRLGLGGVFALIALLLIERGVSWGVTGWLAFILVAALCQAFLSDIAGSIRAGLAHGRILGSRTKLARREGLRAQRREWVEGQFAVLSAEYQRCYERALFAAHRVAQSHAL